MLGCMARRGIGRATGVRGPHGGWFPPVADEDARPVDRGTVRRVIRSFRPYRRQTAVVGSIIVLTSALGVVNPILIKYVFQALFPKTNLRRLVELSSLMIVVPIIGGGLGVVQTYLANVIGQRVMQDFRNALYAHLQHMPLRFFTATRTGEIQSRLANDVGGVQSVVTDTAAGILSNVVIVISTVVAMLFLSWQLTVLSLALTPVFIWLTRKVGRARQAVAANTQKSLAEMSAIAEETLSVSGILLTKTFARQRYEIQRFRQENQRLADLEIKQNMIGRFFFAIVQVFFSIMPALVYLVAGWVIVHQHTHIDPGTIVAFTQRRRILAAYATEMEKKRDDLVHAIEQQMRHAIDLFYKEISVAFEPLAAFCITERKRYEPLVEQADALKESLGGLGRRLSV